MNTLQKLQQADLAPSTKRNYKRHIEAFLSATDTAQEFISKVEGSRSNVNQAINAINWYFENSGHARPLRKMKEKNYHPRAVSRENIKKLYAVADNQTDNLLLDLAYLSGLRLSEIINLRAMDFNFEKSIITINATKNNSKRVTVLHQKTIEQHKILIESRPKLFGYFKRRHLQKEFLKIQKEAGLSGYTLHCLRHSFATHMLESGISLINLSVLMGHQSLDTTRKYLALAKDYKKIPQIEL